MADIKVFIIDDSSVVRQVLSGLLNDVAGINVIGSAIDPIFAEKKMQKDWPDVIILDIEMPRMDGITFLKKLMQEHPTPIVICSTLTEKGADITMQALSAGAVDIITKPKINLSGFFQETKILISNTVKAAAQARMKAVNRNVGKYLEPQPKLNADEVIAQSHTQFLAATTDKVIAIGTSTGGTQALESILTKLPSTAPGIVIVQHMPEAFTAAFARRLDSICQVTVKEAATHDRVIRGSVLIAPGGKHMLLRRNGAQYLVEIKNGPLVSRHRPSVDVLFRSCAQAAGVNAIGIIMTGMGDDGSVGMKEMHDNGSLTIAQDEASCVVYGMPKEAIKKGAVDGSVKLADFIEIIIRSPDRATFIKMMPHSNHASPPTLFKRRVISR
jgi:two-component system, chemotaxis family, protein-glutamate methylesterase/glutaminase